MPYGLRGADEATLEVFGGKLRVKDAGLDASKLADAAGLTYLGANFIIQHNNRAVVRVQTNALRISNTTTPIANGTRVGQILLIVLDPMTGDYVRITDSGNCKLRGNWQVSQPESWLRVAWDGTYWVETGRGVGGNTMSGLNAKAEGQNTLASNDSAHAEGQSVTASGDDAHAEGFNSIASGSASHAEGSSTFAMGHYSHSMGYQCKARLYAMFAQASGNFAANGDAQFTRTVLRNDTGDTNWTELFVRPASVERWLLDDNFTYACMITIAARMNTGGAACAHFTRRLTIERTDGTVTMRSGPAFTYSDHNPGGAYNIQITGDDVNKSLKIQVKHDDGVSPKNVRWVAVIEAVEIEYHEPAPPPPP